MPETATAPDTRTLHYSEAVEIARRTFRVLAALSAAVERERDTSEEGWLWSDIECTLETAHTELVETRCRPFADAYEAPSETRDPEAIIDHLYSDVVHSMALADAANPDMRGPVVRDVEPGLYQNRLRAFIAERHAEWRRLEP